VPSTYAKCRWEQSDVASERHPAEASEGGLSQSVQLPHEMTQSGQPMSVADQGGAEKQGESRDFFDLIDSGAI